MSECCGVRDCAYIEKPRTFNCYTSKVTLNEMSEMCMEISEENTRRYSLPIIFHLAMPPSAHYLPMLDAH